MSAERIGRTSLTIGQRFGRLVILRDLGIPGERTHRRVEVLCDCGVTKAVYSDRLASGDTQSCGCLRAEILLAKHTKHGMTGTAEHAAWVHLKGRCLNPNNKSWSDYGGRGIRVADEWLNDFSAFYDHIGPRPSPEFSIDRIDVDGNYEPGNVRWATRSEQAANQRPRTLRTHCKRGHEYTPENTILKPSTGRGQACKTCAREWQKAQRASGVSA